MVARSLWDAAAAAVVAVVTTLATAADGSLLTVERGTDERLSQLRERARASGRPRASTGSPRDGQRIREGSIPGRRAITKITKPSDSKMP